MKASELKNKNNEELNKMLLELRREQFNLRMQKGTGQLSKPSEVKRVRRDMPSLIAFLDDMEKATLAEQRKLTIPFVKSLIKIT